jgi:hypothetical protein
MGQERFEENERRERKLGRRREGAGEERGKKGRRKSVNFFNSSKIE